MAMDLDYANCDEFLVKQRSNSCFFTRVLLLTHLCYCLSVANLNELECFRYKRKEYVAALVSYKAPHIHSLYFDCLFLVNSASARRSK